MRTATIVLAALSALVPSIAHAEFVTPKEPLEVRPQTVKRVKAPVQLRAAMAPKLSIEDVLSKVNTVYMTGLRRCYERALAVDPSISGKLTLTFTVNAMGHVAPAADGSTNSVNACVSSLASRWKFESPRDDKGMPGDETFRISLVLAAN